MILVSFSIALIAIVFGAKLLAQSNKDNLGALYKYLAWFIIAMGFCVLLCDGARGLLRCARMGHCGMMQKEMRMNGGGHCMMGGGAMGMRHCDEGNMNCMNNNNCCDGGMMNCCGNNCCSGGGMACSNDNSCSNSGSMGCPSGPMNSSCTGGMPANCPMMKGGNNPVTDSMMNAAKTKMQDENTTKEKRKRKSE
jgi:hypothetical protein